MMKRWMALALAVLMTFSFLGCSELEEADYEEAGALITGLIDSYQEDTDPLGEDLVFAVSEAFWKNGEYTIVVEIYNLSEEYHLLGMEDVTITFTDSEGLEIYTDIVNSNWTVKTWASKLCLRPGSKAVYEHSGLRPSELVYDESAYSSLTEGVQVYWTCSYNASICAGESCGECSYAGEDLDYQYEPESKRDLPLPDVPTPDSGDDYTDYTLVACTKCSGSGRCGDCGGSGKSKLSGVTAAGGCGLCEGSGRCYKCGGSGSIKQY